MSSRVVQTSSTEFNDKYLWFIYISGPRSGNRYVASRREHTVLHL